MVNLYTIMAKHRFYLPPTTWDDTTPELHDDEAHHCRDVMRCREGDVVAIFDGAGTEAEARITSVEKKKVCLETLSSHSTEPLPAAITLGQAIPKGKNMELIIQKATELGVARIVPLLSTNTVVQLSDKDRAKKQEKWQRIAIEACKQCGQNWLPGVATPTSVGDYVGADSGGGLDIVAAIDEKSAPLKEILQTWDTQNPQRPTQARLLIGPEGDLTTAEVDAALEAGFAPLSLGPIILRSETAAIYTLSVMTYELMGR